MIKQIYTPAKKSRTPFRKLPSSKKGTAGEKIVSTWFNSRGYLVYKPSKTRSSHPIDFFAYHFESGSIAAFDVKTYPCRSVYGDQGIDLPDFQTYCRIAEKMPVSVVFVDSERRSVYSLEFSPGNIAAGRIEGEKVYFDLQLTKVLFTLLWADIEKL